MVLKEEVEKIFLAVKVNLSRDGKVENVAIADCAKVKGRVAIPLPWRNQEEQNVMLRQAVEYLQQNDCHQVFLIVEVWVNKDGVSEPAILIHGQHKNGAVHTIQAQVRGSSAESVTVDSQARILVSSMLNLFKHTTLN